MKNKMISSPYRYFNFKTRTALLLLLLYHATPQPQPRKNKPPNNHSATVEDTTTSTATNTTTTSTTTNMTQTEKSTRSVNAEMIHAHDDDDDDATPNHSTTKPKSLARLAWETGHKSLGYMTIGLAYPTMYFGTQVAGTWQQNFERFFFVLIGFVVVVAAAMARNKCKGQRHPTKRSLND